MVDWILLELFPFSSSLIFPALVGILASASAESIASGTSVSGTGGEDAAALGSRVGD